jgi:transposase-like protein
VGDASPVSLGDGAPGRERLSGWVEVDEAYIGGVESAVYGRETATKSIVAIAVEIKHSKGFGRIRLQSVADVSQESLIPFIEAVVEPGSTVHTDGWQAYWTVPQRGYTHERTVMRKQNDPAHVVMPGVHRVASLLQRWLLGTHQGGVSIERLDAYLNEFTFRFNRRHSRRRGMLFYRLLEQSIAAEPITYRSLVVNPRTTGRPHVAPSRPGRVAAVPAVHRPWRQTLGNTGPPDLNG